MRERSTTASTTAPPPSPRTVSKDEVTDYVGEVTVRPVTHRGAAFVEWESAWAAQTDAAENFCRTIYLGLLKALKRHFAV